jgi:photosystem II stability/assembly factor-like uncharacterized protein
MRQARRLLAAILLTTLVIYTNAKAFAEPSSLPPEMLEDAELTDIFFLDPDRGWAVGDRGVIWWTDDGGRNWQLADSPVNCRLESVCFVDDLRGWAVGGWPHPYSHRTSGVVLQTDNGGRRWKRIKADTLPQLLSVKFFDDRQGWAVGAPSAMYPSGIFQSVDGGRSWSALPTSERGAWLAADFFNPQHGVIAGRDGTAAAVNRATVAPLLKPNTGLRHLRVARLASTSQLWLAGDGGLLLKSEDAGEHWIAPKLPLANNVAEQIDFRAIAARGNSCWLAGNPGTCLLHSADRGRSWQLLYTDHHLPINALTFLDDQRGWTVGPLGTILATRDGGQSWIRQRSGGSRAAVLGLFSDSTHVPLEVFSRLCGDEAYLGVIELLTRRDVESKQPADATRDLRTEAGIANTGGAFANATWRFPLRQSGLGISASSIVAGWSVANGRDGAKALEENIVLRLRQWRPEIVITHGTQASADDPLSHVINQIVLSAVERAADVESYPAQIRMLRLEPWRVKKLFGTSRNDKSATIVLETSRLATRLGKSIRDHTAASQGLLRDAWSPAPERSGFDLLISQVPRPLAGEDFFSGLSIAPGSDARRRLGHPAPTSLTELRRTTQQHRTIELLLTRAADDARDSTGWLAQIDDLTRGLSPLAGGGILYQLAQHYREVRHYDLSAEALNALVHKYPSHPLVEPSLTWLVGYYASAEVETAFGKQDRTEDKAEQPSFAEAFNAALPPGVNRRVKTTRISSSRNRLAGFDAAGNRVDGHQQLLNLVRTIQHKHPALFAEPSVRLAVAAAHRQRGALHEAKRLYQQVAGVQPFGAWCQTARTELWFDTRRGYAPKPTLPCRRAASKPLLDGKLDDEAWENADQADLKSQLDDDADWPATVKIARDEEYLYLGVACRKLPGTDYPTSDEARSRDRDLSNADRVEFLIDVDRDYNSFFRLTVDHRGWTGEACFGDIRWNPKWFVAAASDADSWFIEAAIPLKEFGETKNFGTNAWAVGIQRIGPGVGFQSWTQPATALGRTDGFGYLVLE